METSPWGLGFNFSLGIPIDLLVDTAPDLVTFQTSVAE
jgi:hypothetical protein